MDNGPAPVETGRGSPSRLLAGASGYRLPSFSGKALVALHST